MALTREQCDFRDVVQSFLAEAVSTGPVGDATRAEHFDTVLWRRMAEELELQALAVPTEYGGTGAGWTEQALVFEAMGASLPAVPYLATNGLACPALLAGEELTRQRYLPGIANGKTIATVAFRHGDAVIEVERSGDGHSLTGTASWALAGACADLALVEVIGPDGPQLYATESFHAEPTPTSDPTRSFAELTFREASAVLVGDGRTVEAARRVGTAMLASEQVGGAASVVDQAVSYAKIRRQFGQPIGRFQAVKHLCADMLVQLEGARTAAENAVAQLDIGTPEALLLTHIAGLVCSDAYAYCASKNVQVHGGIGFTWEHSAHLHVKRSRGSMVFLGTPSDHLGALASSGLVLATT